LGFFLSSESPHSKNAGALLREKRIVPFFFFLHVPVPLPACVSDLNSYKERERREMRKKKKRRSGTGTGTLRRGRLEVLALCHFAEDAVNLNE